MKPKAEHGWGVRVNGPRPYLAQFFSYYRAVANKECTEKYHRPVKVVLLPLAEYRRLKREKK